MGNVEIARATRSPAEVYDEFFVPALFQQWGSVVADIAAIERGHRVLDVACGTGTLACAAAERVGAAGAVTGLDPNEEMLAVARRKNVRVTWKDGRAESLPFPAAAFDRVVSQFGMMFFEDPALAVSEMLRVLHPRGRLAVAVCDGLDRSPGYAVLSELLQRLFGAPVADAFRAPFALGDRRKLRSLCERAGLRDADIRCAKGTVRFESIASLVSTERACAWTLGGVLDDDQFGRLLEEAEESLQPFVTAEGAVAFVMPALIISAEKP